MYVIDTDVSIDYMKGRQYALKLFAQLSEPYVTSMTVAELFYGAYNSKMKEQLLPPLGSFLQNLGYLAMEFWDAVNFGKIKAHLKKKGALAGDADMINAAIAISYDFTLVTRNAKHYENIPGLKLLKA